MLGTLRNIYWSREVEIGEDGVACTLFGNESLKEGVGGALQLERVEQWVWKSGGRPKNGGYQSHMH